jgi:glutamate synthase (NADPH/NADH) small chain
MEPTVLADPLAAMLKRDGDKIHVDDHFRTILPGIYAGGDCVAPGQDLTVQAVEHGKRAALAIHSDIQSKKGAA